MLSGLQAQLTTFGIGSLAEIFNASDPQRPNGCYALVHAGNRCLAAAACVRAMVGCAYGLGKDCA